MKAIGTLSDIFKSYIVNSAKLYQFDEILPDYRRLWRLRVKYINGMDLKRNLFKNKYASIKQIVVQDLH